MSEYYDKTQREYKPHEWHGRQSLPNRGSYRSRSGGEHSEDEVTRYWAVKARGKDVRMDFMEETCRRCGGVVIVGVDSECSRSQSCRFCGRAARLGTSESACRAPRGGRGIVVRMDGRGGKSARVGMTMRGLSDALRICALRMVKVGSVEGRREGCQARLVGLRDCTYVIAKKRSGVWKATIFQKLKRTMWKEGRQTSEGRAGEEGSLQSRLVASRVISPCDFEELRDGERI